MNKILPLFDEKYVIGLLKEKVLPMYPDFLDIKRVKIQPYKKLIWENTYHVVVEFKTTFLTKDGKRKKLPIICSAHSSEPRKNVFESLEFLWEHDFGRGYLTIPHPLFYSDDFRGTFYRGVEGKNLYHYIKEKKFNEIETIVSKTALWFVKLHNLSTGKARNFNEENSRIATVYPGIRHILWRVKENFPQYEDVFTKAYRIFDNREKSFFKSTDRRWLIHGDAHPENIIKMGSKKIAVIDFTDLCLGDFARDIGAFTQQLEYMSSRKIEDQTYAARIKDIFLDRYFKNSPRRKLNEDIRKRIELYYYWTSMRTATFFLIKDKAEPERAEAIVDKIKTWLASAKDNVPARYPKTEE